MKRFREFFDLKRDKQQQQPLATNGTNGATNGAAPATTTPTTAPAGPQMLATPTDADQYRFRRFEGVNMGSWFVNEEWICQSVFQNAASPKQSDLDICKGSNAKANLENHWDTWITTSDWQFIVNQGLNTIRLPIGYYHLSQANVIANTDFAAYGSVFSGAWQRVLKAISTAKSYGLGVLVDLHAAPGGQNTQAHSGTSSGKANLWGNSTNLARTLTALQFLVQNLKGIDNVVGVELLNEPQNGDYLAGWYVQTIQALRKIDANFPLYIHDGFDPEYYAKFVGSRTDLGYVVQDTHFYRCFSSSDTSKSSDAIIQGVIDDTTGFWKQIAGWSKGRVICGEWSAALAPSSLDQSSRSDDSSRGYFAYVQLAMFKADLAGGWMFWTLHKQSGTDTGWSLQNARAANTVPPDFSDYFVVPTTTATTSNGSDAKVVTNGATKTITKQATMKSALQKFQKQLASSKQRDNEYPNVIGKPTDPTDPHTFEAIQNGVTDANGKKKEEDLSEAQSELFRQGFEQGFADAGHFGKGMSGLKVVNVLKADGSEDKENTRTVGGHRIGHLDQWKRIRAKQFVDANPTSASGGSTSTSATATTGTSIWDKVLNLLHLRSGTMKKTLDTFENVEAALMKVWEFMDGFEEGIKAFESGAVDDSVVSAESQGAGKSAVEKWGEQFVEKEAGKNGLRSLF